MADKCSKCGAKFVKYPLKDEQGKIIWINLFKMDLVSLLFLISIILVIVGFYLDTNKCQDLYEHPAKFCKDSGCIYPSQQTQEEQLSNLKIDSDLTQPIKS